MVLLCASVLCSAAFEKTEKTPSAGLANPWMETDPEGLMKTLGLQFEVPEEAEEVIYRMNESEQIAEMQFVLNDIPFNARIKPAGLEMEDISGMNYEWDYEKESNDRWFQEKIMRGRDGKDTVEVFLWFDIVPGLTYSLSCKAPDLDGFDITAVAEMVYHRVQGNV